MTPFELSPETQEQMKMAQRAQIRLHQAFQLFTLKIAYGAAPRDAINDIDEAMDVWGDYQDAHTIDMPAIPDAMGAIVNKFNAFVDGMEKERNDNPAKDYRDETPGREAHPVQFMEPEQIGELEEAAWMRFQNKVGELNARAESMAPEATAELEEEIAEAEAHWEAFGTKQLRLRLQSLEGAVISRRVCKPGTHLFAIGARPPRFDDACLTCGRKISELADYKRFVPERKVKP